MIYYYFLNGNNNYFIISAFLHKTKKSETIHEREKEKLKSLVSDIKKREVSFVL